MKRSFAG